MRDNWSQTQILELWREIERLNERVKKLETIFDKIDKVLEDKLIKFDEAIAKRNESGKTTLSELTKKSEEPMALSQQQLEEWLLTEQERKELNRERDGNKQVNIIPKG